MNVSFNTFFKKLRPFIAVLIILALFVPVFSPRQAEANILEGLVDGITSFGACKLAGLSADLIQDLQESTEPPEVEETNESNQVPVHVKTDDPFSTEVVRQITELDFTKSANCWKKAALQFISEQILGKIVQDSGFVTNFQDLLGGAVSLENQNFLAELSVTNVCPHTRSAVFTLLGGAGSGFAPDEDGGLTNIVNCTLGEVLDLENGGLQAFHDDFRAGGWDAWLEVIKPHNTLLGSYLIAKEERGARLGAAVAAQQLEAQASEGVHPKKERECVRSVTLPLPTGDGEQEVCIEHKDTILTPGSTLSDQIKRAAGIQLDDLRGSDMYFEILYEIFKGLGDMLVDNIFDDGLSSFGSGEANDPTGNELGDGMGDGSGDSGGTGDDGTGEGGDDSQTLGQISGEPDIVISGPTQLDVGQTGRYSIRAQGPFDDDFFTRPFVAVDWDDGETEDTTATVNGISGMASITLPHAWSSDGVYTIGVVVIGQSETSRQINVPGTFRVQVGAGESNGNEGDAGGDDGGSSDDDDGDGSSSTPPPGSDALVPANGTPATLTVRAAPNTSLTISSSRGSVDTVTPSSGTTNSAGEFTFGVSSNSSSFLTLQNGTLRSSGDGKYVPSVITVQSSGGAVESFNVTFDAITSSSLAQEADFKLTPGKVAVGEEVEIYLRVSRTAKYGGGGAPNRYVEIMGTLNRYVEEQYDFLSLRPAPGYSGFRTNASGEWRGILTASEPGTVHMGVRADGRPINLDLLRSAQWQ